MVDEGAYHLKGKPELSASRRKKLPVPTGVSRIIDCGKALSHA